MLVEQVPSIGTQVPGAPGQAQRPPNPGPPPPFEADWRETRPTDLTLCVMEFKKPRVQIPRCPHCQPSVGNTLVHHFTHTACRLAL